MSNRQSAMGNAESFKSLKASNKISSPLYFLIKPKYKMIFCALLIANCLLASDLLIFSPKLSYSGCRTSTAFFSVVNKHRSLSTFSLISIKASTGLIK